MSKVKVGIIGGSGLDDPDFLKNRQEKIVTTPFGSPSDCLVMGQIGNVDCIILARHGRTHGIMPGKVNYRANIWALKQEGCTHIIATTATGSLHEHIKPGDLLVLDSFIDRTTGRKQTFYDGELPEFSGVCHMPMEPAYCERTRQLIISTAAELNIDVHKNGTVVAIEGPRFGSKAESFMLKAWGGHVINMTSIPEIVLAKEAAICYAQIALATDYDCWRTHEEPVSHPAVLKMFKENVVKITKLIMAIVPKIGSENWDETIQQHQKILKGAIN